MFWEVKHMDLMIQDEIIKHKIQDELWKYMFLMIQDEITYVREKWGRFEENCGGAIPKSSCRTRLVLMTMTGTTMRTWQGQGGSCVNVYFRLRKRVLSSRTSSLLRPRRLSASHKERFTPTYPMQDSIVGLCNMEFSSCGGLLELWRKNMPFRVYLDGYNFLIIC